jgi:hypothetical protein
VTLWSHSFLFNEQEANMEKPRDLEEVHCKAEDEEGKVPRDLVLMLFSL